MGLFNSIFADLYCPTTGTISENTEIQIKWQDPEVRGLNSYHIGDVLEEIENDYNDTWIRTDFICNVCSKFTKGWKGIRYIKTDDQNRHVIFVRTENARICEILSAKRGQAQLSWQQEKGPGSIRAGKGARLNCEFMKCLTSAQRASARH